LPDNTQPYSEQFGLLEIDRTALLAKPEARDLSILVRVRWLEMRDLLYNFVQFLSSFMASTVLGRGVGSDANDASKQQPIQPFRWKLSKIRKKRLRPKLRK
jgi:hypothetical protein